MSTEAKRQLERAAAEPRGTVDVDAIVRRGRAKRRLRYATWGAAAVILLPAVAFGAANLARNEAAPRPDPAHHEDGVFVPADDNDVTYILSDFLILYPFREADQMFGSQKQADAWCEKTILAGRCRVRHDRAGVAMRWSWSSSRFPGNVECRTTLYDEHGTIVGKEIWNLSSAQRVQPLPGHPVGRRGFAVPIEVDGEPVRADGSCEAGQYPGGPGVEVTFAGTKERESPAGGSYQVMLFDAKQLDEHSDLQMCRLTVRFENGKVERTRFGTNQGEGRWEVPTEHPTSERIEDASIKCRAYRGEGQVTD